jgi:hypothetical protein
MNASETDMTNQLIEEMKELLVTFVTKYEPDTDDAQLFEDKVKKFLDDNFPDWDLQNIKEIVMGRLTARQKYAIGLLTETEYRIQADIRGKK